MSDLADIAAAAGISIVDNTNTLTDSGDTIQPGNYQHLHIDAMSSVHLLDGSGDTPAAAQEVQALEALFSHRYTEDDHDYVKTSEASHAKSKPPFIENYYIRNRNQRDNRSWQRGRWDSRHDNRGHRGRGDNRYDQGNWNQRQSNYNSNRSWRERHRDDDYSDRRSYDSGDRGYYRDNRPMYPR